MADILPFNVPSRAELWRRLRLAESIINHRMLLPQTTVEELSRVLRGEQNLAVEPRKPGLMDDVLVWPARLAAALNVIETRQPSARTAAAVISVLMGEG